MEVKSMGEQKMKKWSVYVLIASTLILAGTRTATAGYEIALQYANDLAAIAKKPNSPEQDFIQLCRMLNSIDVRTMKANTVSNSLKFHGVRPDDIPDKMYMAAVATFIVQHTLGEQRDNASFLQPYVAMNGSSGGASYGVIYMRQGGDPTAVYARGGKIIEIRGGKSGSAANALNAYSFSDELGNAIVNGGDFDCGSGNADDCAPINGVDETTKEIKSRVSSYFDRRVARKYNGACP